jgi:hypothetical protein
MLVQKKESERMSNSEYKTDLIEVAVSGAFKTDHVFVSSLQTLGVLSLNTSKGEGIFQAADGSKHELRKTSFWKSVFELTCGGEKIASATPRGAFKRAFDLQYENEVFSLIPKGSKLRSWSIRDAQERTICEFLPRSGLKRGARIRIGSEIPLPLLVFGYLLVIRRWQEESSAA